MAQGTLKKSGKGSFSKKTPAKKPTGPQRGTRVIAPKKPSLIARRQLARRTTAGLTALTERNLAQRAGHLELLGGGKKEKKKVDKKMEGGEKKKA